MHRSILFLSLVFLLGGVLSPPAMGKEAKDCYSRTITLPEGAKVLVRIVHQIGKHHTKSPVTVALDNQPFLSLPATHKKPCFDEKAFKVDADHTLHAKKVGTISGMVKVSLWLLGPDDKPTKPLDSFTFDESKDILECATWDILAVPSESGETDECSCEGDCEHIYGVGYDTIGIVSLLHGPTSSSALIPHEDRRPVIVYIGGVESPLYLEDHESLHPSDSATQYFIVHDTPVTVFASLEGTIPQGEFVLISIQINGEIYTGLFNSDGPDCMEWILDPGKT